MVNDKPGALILTDIFHQSGLFMVIYYNGSCQIVNIIVTLEKNITAKLQGRIFTLSAWPKEVILRVFI